MRSKGKFGKEEKYIKWKKKWDVAKDKKTDDDTHDISYMRIPAEVHAFFTEAIRSIHDPKDLKDWLSQFKENHVNWDSLTPKIKKALLVKAAGYWHKREKSQEILSDPSLLKAMEIFIDKKLKQKTESSKTSPEISFRRWWFSIIMEVHHNMSEIYPEGDEKWGNDFRFYHDKEIVFWNKLDKNFRNKIAKKMSSQFKKTEIAHKKLLKKIYSKENLIYRVKYILGRSFLNNFFYMNKNAKFKDMVKEFKDDLDYGYIYDNKKAESIPAMPIKWDLISEDFQNKILLLLKKEFKKRTKSMKKKIVKESLNEYMESTPHGIMGNAEFSEDEIYQTILNTEGKHFGVNDLRDLIEFFIETNAPVRVATTGIQQFMGIHPNIQHDYLAGGESKAIIEGYMDLMMNTGRKGPDPRMN